MGAALVTGAAGGIGKAIVDALTNNGHRVAAADIAQAPDVIQMDVADAASVDAGVTQAERELGQPISILVNAAGWEQFHPFTETDEAFWERVIEINYKGVLRTCQRILPGMVENNYGRIVNIASDAGRVGSTNEAVYAGAKGGVIAFTKTLAREHARHGVTANAVCPGPTDTPMLANMAGENAEKLIEALKRAIPMRRLGQPEDVAAAVAFLASDKAAFITGQTLSVSGGLTMA